jgi:hypothetical protein
MMNKQHFIAGAVALIIAAPLAYMVFDRRTPIIVEAAYVASPQPLRPGQKFRIGYNVNRIKLCSYTIQPIMFDGAKIRYEWDSQRLHSGGELGEDSYFIERTLPEGAKEGQGRYFTVLLYACNPLQQFWPVRVQTPAIHFTIGNAEQ